MRARAIACPQCGGALQPTARDRYRCRLDHSFTEDELAAVLDKQALEAVKAAMRGLRDSAATHVRLAERADRAHMIGAAAFRERAHLAKEQADVLEQVFARLAASEEPARHRRGGGRHRQPPD